MFSWRLGWDVWCLRRVTRRCNFVMLYSTCWLLQETRDKKEGHGEGRLLATLHYYSVYSYLYIVVSKLHSIDIDMLVRTSNVFIEILVSG